MNTGVQDAQNLAWKLALAVSGHAAEGLLDSYDAERRPVGEEVVGRTVRSAREGMGADSTDPSFVMRREAQLLIDYGASPIVAPPLDEAAGPRPGIRAPDARALTRDAVTTPLCLFTLLSSPRHTLLCYAGPDCGPEAVECLEQAADTAVQAAHAQVDVYVVAHPDAEVDSTVLPLIRDSDGDFARSYAAEGISAFVVRPDGYLGFVSRGHVDPDDLVAHLKLTFS